MDLKQAGARIWMDKLDIHPGQEWERTLEEAITDCSRIVVILSPSSVESKNVMAEVAFGLDEKKEIIPVLYRDCKIPFRLRPIQYVDFRKELDYRLALNELLRTLGLEEATAEVTTELKNGGQRRYRVWIKTAIAVAVLVAACWLSYSILSKGRSGAPQLQSARRTAPEQKLREPDAGDRIALPSFGWAVGLGGIILHTEDAGSTWSTQTSGITENLIAGTFVTPQVGWLVGADGGVLHTVDGGATWIAQSVKPKRYLASVVFSTLRSGWITGSEGTVLHTEDGGEHWMPQDSGTGETLYCAVLSNQQAGWIVGSAGTILHTENGGRNWNPQNAATKYTLYSASFPAPTSGWAVGNHGTIVHTEDGGINWKTQISDAEIDLISVFFPTPSSGWAVGKNGIIVHTADRGATWTRQSSGTAVHLHSIWFANPLWGWAAGERGVLLHTEDGGESWRLFQPGANADLIVNAVIFPQSGRQAH